MKKTNKSFADRAKLLIKRYSRSDFDTNERRELDAALQKLSEEQEQYKMANKIGEYSDEAMAQKAMQQQEIMAQQGQMQPDSQVGQMVGQGDRVPQQFWEGGGFKAPKASDYFNTGQTQQNAVSTIYPKNVMYPMTANNGSGVQSVTQQPIVGQDQQIGQTQSILPSIIAGGIGMIGNSLLAAGVKDNQFNQSYSADQISLAKERERLSREATSARNIGMRNLSGAGSRGAYLAGAGNVSAGINQQLANSLSDSYFKEEATNLAQREKASDLNRQVAMMNYQAKINAQNERAGYLAAAAGIPAQTMADIGKINYQNSALLSSGTDNYLAGVNSKANPWKSQQIYRKFKK